MWHFGDASAKASAWRKYFEYVVCIYMHHHIDPETSSGWHGRVQDDTGQE